MRERNAIAIPGLVMVVVIVAMLGLAALLLITGLGVGDDPVTLGRLFAGTVIAVAAGLAASGFVVIQPNQSAVVTFLGTYLGTVHTSGFAWTWPLTLRRIVSLRVQNFDSQILKVNDAVGTTSTCLNVLMW